MRIALVQQHATNDKADNVARGLRAFETAARAGAELCVSPSSRSSLFTRRTRRGD